MADTPERNEARAWRAAEGIDAYAAARGMSGEPHKEVVIDFLTDLHHFAARTGVDISQAFNTAAGHFKAETT